MLTWAKMNNTNVYLVKAQVTVVCKNADEKVVNHTFNKGSVNISISDFGYGFPFMHGMVSLYETNTWDFKYPKGLIPVCIKYVKIISVKNLKNF